MNRAAEDVLKEYFGYDSFRKGQETVIDAILSGCDAVAVMPTGSGKSVCYQVPAVMMPGVTLVISPLISLMQDQVKSLNGSGIRAAYINSSLTDRQISKVLQLAAAGTYRIIYIAPERLDSRIFLDFAVNTVISQVCVDEAHCISQWGQDFRPGYLRIIDFINRLPTRPVVSAFTATATREVLNDIICSLSLVQPKVVVTGYDRENLYYKVENVRDKRSYVMRYASGHKGESGIIYCTTRKNTDQVYELLRSAGISCAKYHAGMDAASRKENQDDFIYDRASVIVATNAFGMGIDKSNVRYVLHYNMPQSVENYYQEAGRAGRDGADAECVLLFSPQDVIINKFLIENKEQSELDYEDAETVRSRDMKRLRMMEEYCLSKGCLRNYILSYFGEEAEGSCGHCGGCDREYRETDMTDAAKQIINCVWEARGRYGAKVIVQTLRGSKAARLEEIGATKYRSHGTLKKYKEETLRDLIDQMVDAGLLRRTEDQYGVIQLGDISPLKAEDGKFMMKVSGEPDELLASHGKVPSRRITRAGSGASLTSAGFELFDKLKRLRFEIAREEAIPPYIVFSDKALIDMCIKLPSDETGFMSVSGVGAKKLEKYGSRFMAAISEFTEDNPGRKTALTGAAEDDVSDGSSRQPEPAGRRRSGKGRARKREFYITAEQAERFEYGEFYYASEICAKLNDIRDAVSVKQVLSSGVLDYLTEQGCIYDTGEVFKGRKLRMPTDDGVDAGIIAEERISKDGEPYKLVKYPAAIQRRIVQHFVKSEDVTEI